MALVNVTGFGTYNSGVRQYGPGVHQVNDPDEVARLRRSGLSWVVVTDDTATTPAVGNADRQAPPGPVAYPDGVETTTQDQVLENVHAGGQVGTPADVEPPGAQSQVQADPDQVIEEELPGEEPAEVPVVGKPVADYDELNASDAVEALLKIKNEDELRAARYYEASNEGRKTVLVPVDKRLEELKNG